MKKATIHSRFRLFALAGALCGLIAVSTAVLLPAANALSPSGLKIYVVDVDPDLGTLTILGQGFDVAQDTTVTLGEFGVLDILFETSDTIVVDLPQDIIPGNYLLEVETSGGSSGHDEFDLTYAAVGPEGPEGPEGPQGPEGASPWLLTNDGLIHTETNVGVGTANPDDDLDIARFDTDARLIVQREQTPAQFANLSATEHYAALGFKDTGTLRIGPVGTTTDTPDVASSVVLDGNGNVGIGTDAAANRLSVAGSADFSGNVGIGTTNAQARLDISDSDVNSAIRFHPAGAGPEMIYKAHQGGTKDLHVLFEDASGAQTEVMMIKGNANTGNVGIGTTDPTTKLDVAGTIRSSTGGFVFPDGTVQTTAAATGECTEHYITTTRANKTFENGSVLLDYPDPFCPPGWTTGGSWTSKMAGMAVDGDTGAPDLSYNYVRQTLCSKCE